jgi:uncharacterized protein YkuJ
MKRGIFSQPLINRIKVLLPERDGEEVLKLSFFSENTIFLLLPYPC